jgi:hypothetical protein
VPREGAERRREKRSANCANCANGIDIEAKEDPTSKGIMIMIMIMIMIETQEEIDEEP